MTIESQMTDEQAMDARDAGLPPVTAQASPVCGGYVGTEDMIRTCYALVDARKRMLEAEAEYDAARCAFEEAIDDAITGRTSI